MITIDEAVSLRHWKVMHRVLKTHIHTFNYINVQNYDSNNTPFDAAEKLSQNSQ